MTTEDYFFTTLKGARGQLSHECELIKGKAYQEAYDKAISDPKELKKVEDEKITKTELVEKAIEKAQTASNKAFLLPG